LRKLEEAGCEIVMCRPGALPQEEELRELIPGCVGYVAGVETISARVFEKADALKAISRNGTGADAIDHAAAQRVGVRILCAHGANARGVAELTMALILALARSLPPTDRSLKAGDWVRHAGFELEGKTLGLVGCGRIGRLVTGFAAAFGMQVRASDPFPNWPEAPASFRFAAFEEVCADADVLSLHCPPPPGGRPLLDAGGLAGLKRGVLLVNTARAGLIETEALLAALDAGHVAGIGLDVFDEEPPRDRRLLEHPRVIASPHIGGFTPESVDRAMNQAVDNLLGVLP
jgi:phosphoglycerate dehydrogenase-like enzyme